MSLDYNSEIESLAISEDKIVTYKLISQNFDLTPLEAKKILQDFVTTSRNEKVQKFVFFVTYSIFAEHRETKRKQLLLVNEQDLEGITNDYRIISKQVYSIQKNFVEDFDLIYGNDLPLSNCLNRKANIKALNVTMRDETQLSGFTTSSSADSISTSSSAKSTIKNDIGLITTKTQETKLTDTHKPAESEKLKVKQEPTEKQHPVEATTSSTSSANSTTHKKSASSGGIAAMFSKQKELQQKKAVKEETSEKSSSEEKHEQTASIFKKKKSPEAKKPERKEVSKKVLSSIKQEFDSDVEMTVEDEEPKKDTKKHEKEKHATKSPAKADKNDLFDDEHDAEILPSTADKESTTGDEDEYEDEQINKKRRRKGSSKKKNSQVINSDDEEGDNENKKASKKPKIKKPDNNKEIDQMLNKENRINDTHQKKQLVTKTFVDSDGYKVTKKVWETVEDDTASHDANIIKPEVKAHDKHEDKHAAKKQNESKTQQKTVLNQPTLTNFFKRN